MPPEIIISVIAGAASVLSALSGVLVSAKLTNYRLSQLEEKVRIHNNLVERVSMLELHRANIQSRQDELFRFCSSRINKSGDAENGGYKN